MINWIFFLILIELVIVSWIDIKTRKISNYWFVANLIIATIIHFLYPNTFKWELLTFAYPIGCFLIGFLLFLIGVMGAGDSKILASLFLVVPSGQQSLLLEKIIYCTLTVGLITLTIKIGKDFQKIKAYAFSTYWQGLKDSIRSKFSYAPVILLAWILLGVGQWK